MQWNRNKLSPRASRSRIAPSQCAQDTPPDCRRQVSSEARRYRQAAADIEF